MYDIIDDIGFTASELRALKLRIFNVLLSEYNGHCRVFFTKLIEAINISIRNIEMEGLSI